jgi:hypothetical protein
MDLETKNVRRLTREKEKVQFPVWSPDGKTIAINRSGDDQKGDLLLVDAGTGATRTVQPTVKDGILWPAAFAPDGQSLLLRARNEKGFVQMAVLPLTPASNPGNLPEPKSQPAFIGPGDWDVIEAHWTKDGFVFLRNEGGIGRLGILPWPGGVHVHQDAALGLVRPPAELRPKNRSHGILFRGPARAGAHLVK